MCCTRDDPNPMTKWDGQKNNCYSSIHGALRECGVQRGQNITFSSYKAIALPNLPQERIQGISLVVVSLLKKVPPLLN